MSIHVLGNYIPELIINGTKLDSVKKAMAIGIKTVAQVAGVLKVSAGNYNGELGRYKIFLKEILE